jgi:S1-C subfamily serine protease
MARSGITIGTILALAILMQNSGQIQNPENSFEEAVAKIKPAVGILYREVAVYDSQKKFKRVVWENAGTLTVIKSEENNSCAATAAHGLAQKGQTLRTVYKPIEEFKLNDKDPAFDIKNPKTWKIVKNVIQEVQEVHIFTGRYSATFDGQTLILNNVELIASRGGAGLWDDFAVFRVPIGKMPTVSFGEENMVKQGSKVFIVHSPIGLIQSVTQGIIARHIDEKMPTTGSGLPFVRPVFVLDIKIAPGTSGSFLYTLRGNTGYAIGVVTGYFYIGTPQGGQIGDIFPHALGISIFKKFLQEEKVFEKCAAPY